MNRNLVQRLNRSKKLNDRGAAMVSVIVITAFITALATTMLFVAGKNYMQKQTDYENKQSFYGAEEALDALKTLLVQDAAAAYKAAYQDTASNYIKLASDEARINNYQKAYTDYLTKLWLEGDRCNYGTEDKLTAIIKLMEAGGIPKDVRERIYSVDGFGVSTSGTFVIKGVRAKCTIGSYTTFLYTDIAINIPEYGKTFVDSSSSGDEITDKKIVSLTDYVVYMNWRRADYYENEEVSSEISTT